MEDEVGTWYGVYGCEFGMLMVRTVWSGGRGGRGGMGMGGAGKGRVWSHGLRCDLHFKESQAGRIKEDVCVCEDVYRHSAKSTPSIGAGGDYL